MKSLVDWLAHCERLHPTSIDLTLERVRSVYERLGFDFACPVIGVAGTNGKGSTCAMLESIAQQAGYRVGLYSKPHLVHFEERCRVDGRPFDAERLVPHFEAVEAARGETTLTYFEFTTLAIMRALAAQPLDLVILEVGLGGRLDAVNVIDADCAVITSIDIDHTEYLGSDRETIGREKAGIFRAGKPAVVSDPRPPASVLEVAKDTGADLWLAGRDFTHSGDRQQWNWRGREKRFSALAYPTLRGANQVLNAAGALAALESLRDRLPIAAQAVRQGLARIDLRGRFQIVPGQPALVLDVAHNPHAVAALALNLDQMGYFPRNHAVFGAMGDKDLRAVLTRMAPLVDAWYFTDLPTARAASAVDLAALLGSIGAARDATVSTHGNPADALKAAASSADPADRIVVFGSFYTVGGVLKDGTPRLGGNDAG